MADAWEPGCSIEHLRLRAKMLGDIRQFFLERAVLEVETPLLSHTAGTDPQLEFFTTDYHSPPLRQTLFLQTSPEFAMKRLLAAGSGSIFQICKAFRNNESGRFHNPEFTMLEWYRTGFDLVQLMDEIADLITHLFARVDRLLPIERISYSDLFLAHTGLDPLVFCPARYAHYALSNDLPEAVTLCAADHALWLDFLFSHCIQPRLSLNKGYLVYHYPACQSSLARLNPDNPGLTERVELFIGGMELGNGYFELSDPVEQERRFDREMALRKAKNLPLPVKDGRLLAALHSGLPDCAGMAIGLDRVLMLLSEAVQIDQVLSFSINRA